MDLYDSLEPHEHNFLIGLRMTFEDAADKKAFLSRLSFNPEVCQVLHDCLACEDLDWPEAIYTVALSAQMIPSVVINKILNFYDCRS